MANLNDGFCDVCRKYKGEQDMKTLWGVLFCSDCREEWKKIKRHELVEWFRRILGKTSVF